MSKPICKSEARWKFWRDEGKCLNKFIKYEKQQMIKAKRRFFKILLRKDLDS